MLAAEALASVRSLSRDMAAQERRLDPARDHMKMAQDELVSVNPVAVALQRRFGRPVAFREASIEHQADGGTLYRLRTEFGAVCFRSMPPLVELAAPGQGVGHTQMVPMNCPK